MKYILLTIIALCFLSCDKFETDISMCNFPEYSIIEYWSNEKIACVKCFDSQHERNNFDNNICRRELPSNPGELLDIAITDYCECLAAN